MDSGKAAIRWTTILGALVLTACSGDEIAAPVAPPPAEVSVVTLKTQPVTLFREFPGRVTASVVAEVRPQVSGIVKERLFQEGGLVEAGEVLYRLDDDTYRADANSAKAALERAQATRHAAELAAARSEELSKVNAISVQDNENAIAALRQAQADVGVAAAAYERARVMLGYAQITAPISGRIGISSVTQGALVTANQAATLAIVQKLDPVHVDVMPSNIDFLHLQRGLASGTLTSTRELPVTILLEDGSVYQHPGHLSFADLSVDPTTSSLSLRVTVANPDDTLLPGAYVRAVVSAGRRENGVLVPQRAVTRDPKGNTSVLIVDAQNTVVLRPIVVSNAIEGQWLVEDGLEDGERVIVEGLQKVAPGAVVQASEVSNGAAPITAAGG